MWLIPAGYALFLALLVVRYVRRHPRLRDYPPQPHGPFVSVIVPARDEEVNIERCDWCEEQSCRQGGSGSRGRWSRAIARRGGSCCCSPTPTPATTPSCCRAPSRCSGR